MSKLTFNRILFLAIVSFSFVLLFSHSDANALDYKTAFYGNFNGEHHHFQISKDFVNVESIASGNMHINGEAKYFLIYGFFSRLGFDQLNPNCDRVTGLLEDDSTDIKLILHINGKNCRYGMTSYLFGTFTATRLDGMGTHEGNGLISIVTDEHLTSENTHNFYGNISGSIRN